MSQKKITERRKNPRPTEASFYQLRPDALTQTIARERRQDVLMQLLDVQQQKRVWRRVVTICLLLNLLLLALALWGANR